MSLYLRQLFEGFMPAERGGKLQADNTVAEWLRDVILRPWEVPALKHIRDAARRPSRADLRAMSFNPSVTRKITYEEVKKHDSEDDCWIVIEGHVYDVTKFAKYHPGGPILFSAAGRKDATDLFVGFHSPEVYKKLKTYHIGDIAEADLNEEFTREYRQLEEHFDEVGFYNANIRYYVVKAAICAMLLVTAFACVLLTNDYWWHMVGAVCVALLWQQGAFIAHDALHNAIFPDIKRNYIAGWFSATLVFGISATQWKDEHNIHHAVTNQVHEDLQFTYLPIWLLDTKELDDKGTKKINNHPVGGLLIKLQHFTFIPLCVILGRLNIYFLSTMFALGYDVKQEKYRAVLPYELLGMALYWVWYGSLLYLVPSGGERWAFFFLSHVLVGILHVQLTVSHMATEMFHGNEQEDLEFIRFQCRSTRNIASSWWSHWFHGGLHLQVEHHLFPRLPRHNLSLATGYVKPLCEKYNLPYVEVGFIEACRDVCMGLYETQEAAFETGKIDSRFNKHH